MPGPQDFVNAIVGWYKSQLERCGGMPGRARALPLATAGRLLVAVARRRRPGAAVALVASVAFLACSGSSDGAADGAPRVVASTALLAEFARQVAGEDVSVTSIIPPGVDAHSFEPNPDIAKRIARAQLLVVNGYGLEESILKLVVANRRSGVPIVVAAAGLEPLAGGRHEDGTETRHDSREGREQSTLSRIVGAVLGLVPGRGQDEAHEDEEHEDEEHGKELAERLAGEERLMVAEGDPHFWLDVAHAVSYVERIRDALVAVDASRADGYRERAAAFIAELRALDGEIRAQIEAVPAARRKIVVFHDAFAYLGKAYGFTVVASVLPANPNKQASTRQVAEIVELIRRERIPAVYAVATLSSQVLEAIAADSGARVLPLHELLGPGAESYEAMMRANARALVDGLGR